MQSLNSSTAPIKLNFQLHNQHGDDDDDDDDDGDDDDGNNDDDDDDEQFDRFSKESPASHSLDRAPQRESAAKVTFFIIIINILIGIISNVILIMTMIGIMTITFTTCW